MKGEEYYTKRVCLLLGRLLTLSEYQIKEECMSMGLEPHRTVELIKRSHEKA